MTTAFFHEALHRSEDTLRRIAEFPVTVCGAGALGANIIENLARQGFGRLAVIDCDRVEERNLSTQPYFRGDIGAQKAKILGNNIYRALGTAPVAHAVELTASNARKLFTGSALVVDAFDNSVSRRVVAETCSAMDIPCIHAGLANSYAEVIWNDIYRVPSDANDDICDYPLARNLVLLTVATACEAIVDFASAGNGVEEPPQRSYTITLGDLAVREYKVAS